MLHHYEQRKVNHHQQPSWAQSKRWARKKHAGRLRQIFLRAQTIGAFCVLVLLQGCSWVFVRGAPANHYELEAFECTSTVAPPILDTLVWAAGVVGTVLYASRPAGEPMREVGIVSNAATAVVYGLAAQSGFRKTAHCRQAKAEMQTRRESMAQRAPGCTTDMECKGERVCLHGICVAPQ